jgi:hypothetical protein
MILFKYIGTRGFCFWGMNFHNLGGKKEGVKGMLGFFLGGRGKSGPKSPHYEEKKS